MVKLIRLLWLLPVLLVFSGCGAAKIPHKIVPDYVKKPARVIAVAPIKNEAAAPLAAEMLREELIEGLYFKGYPRVSVQMIDALVAQITADGASPSAPRIGERLPVDAVLFATLKEARPGRGIFYASTAVAAVFVLQSARTGEELWRVEYTVVNRSWGITPQRVEMKSAQVFEPAMQEVVDRALETLPDAAGS